MQTCSAGICSCLAELNRVGDWFMSDQNLQMLQVRLPNTFVIKIAVSLEEMTERDNLSPYTTPRRALAVSIDNRTCLKTIRINLVASWTAVRGAKNRI